MKKEVGYVAGSDPDPFVRGTDPRIRIRIRTKMSRIPNMVLTVIGKSDVLGAVCTGAGLYETSLYIAMQSITFANILYRMSWGKNLFSSPHHTDAFIFCSCRNECNTPPPSPPVPPICLYYPERGRGTGVSYVIRKLYTSTYNT
jgi:hypothetical protein